MKQALYGALFASIVAVVWWPVAGMLIGSADANPTRAQWEYKAVSVAYPKVKAPAGVHETPVILRDLGREGWDICGATALGRFHTYTLKRSK